MNIALALILSRASFVNHPFRLYTIGKTILRSL